MDKRELIEAVEAVCFASGDPVPVKRLKELFPVPPEEVDEAVTALEEELRNGGRGIRLIRLEDSVQLCVAAEYAGYARKCLEVRKPPKLGRSVLETLAAVAYYQPVTRVFIEELRGVDSTYTMSTLLERGLIEPHGRLQAPGRPLLYVTTEEFLRVFGLKSLEELPGLPEEKEASEQEQQLREAIEAAEKKRIEKGGS